MKQERCTRWAAAAALLAAAGLPQTALAQATPPLRSPMDRSPMPMRSDMASLPTAAQVQQAIAGWPERVRLAANLMTTQYGPPQQVSPGALVWENIGPYKRILLMREEQPHDFPKVHMDFLEHTVAYQVPEDKAGEVLKFDGSVTINRTAGELSARCDLESHNILALNMANDIATGKKDAKEARMAFAETIVKEILGEHPDYTEKLQFEPKKDAASPDKNEIPGSPVRVKTGGNPDAEALATVAAINENEIVAAMVAGKKKIDGAVKDYAKMLHEEHGKNMDMTLKLGLKTETTPTDTPEIDKMKSKAAGELAPLALLDGKAFEQGYLQMMIKGHQEALDTIDNKLLPKAQKEEIKRHLTETRVHVAHHLEMAKELAAKK